MGQNHSQVHREDAREISQGMDELKYKVSGYESKSSVGLQGECMAYFMSLPLSMDQNQCEGSRTVTQRKYGMRVGRPMRREISLALRCMSCYRDCQGKKCQVSYPFSFQEGLG